MPIQLHLNQPAYSVASLPPIIHDGIDEVQHHAQASMPLLADSALSAMPMACQGIVGVRSPIDSITPTSLLCLSIVGLDEHQSAADSLFSHPSQDNGHSQQYRDQRQASAKKKKGFAIFDHSKNERYTNMKEILKYKKHDKNDLMRLLFVLKAPKSTLNHTQNLFFNDREPILKHSPAQSEMIKKHAQVLQHRFYKIDPPLIQRRLS